MPVTSIIPAASSRTFSRRARCSAVNPPPSAYLMSPAYPATGHPASLRNPAIEDRLAIAIIDRSRFSIAFRKGIFEIRGEDRDAIVLLNLFDDLE